ncbi:MAG TPA: carboxypeptidase regulatory-like domain-containing protein [Gemmatimonadaceae bacterium]|nr:carboxypeptidase regulatory-like domain-containing protein [Gemmatimonadaceae bacterium]HRQ79407.1 carboxypeptidase regulatory-like domain-containing protein [Gemmatimonadaceae bacterium]
MTPVPLDFRSLLVIAGLAVSTSLATAAAAQDRPSTDAVPGAIAGIVRDENGRPIAGARVSIEALATQTSTDSTGRFVLGGLQARNVTVVFRHLGYRPAVATLEVPAGQTLNLGISLVPLAEELTAVVVRAAILNQVAGTVINEANVPIPDVTVDILGLNRKITTSDAGRFLLTDLAPGSYIMQFRAPGYRVSQYALRMIPQIDRDITIKLRPITPGDRFTAEMAAQVALETNQRIGFRGAFSMVIGREELERWDTAPLGVALNGSAAGNMMRNVPQACVLINGFEALTAQTAGSGFISAQASSGNPTSINPRGSASSAPAEFSTGATGGWLNHFRANEVEMVELYERGHENSRTMCQRFPPSSGCACPPDPAGIVIWLKR